MGKRREREKESATDILIFIPFVKILQHDVTFDMIIHSFSSLFFASALLHLWLLLLLLLLLLGC
jgi:hypothetical protein